MNKKKLMLFVLPLLAIALVTAGYFAVFSTTFNVVSSIEIGGDIAQDLEGVYDGGIIIVDEISLTNNAPSLMNVIISDDAPVGIETTYKSTLTLAQKNVDFSLDIWTLLTDGQTSEVEYVLVGDEFTAEVVEGVKDGYVLIYYADNEDRFANPEVAILVEDVLYNLPDVNDENADLNDYSLEYPTTPHGAKLWYVPSTAILTDNKLDWSRAGEFLFETELIQYNANGEIIIYPGQTLTIIPEYTIAPGTSGDYTITTTVA